MEQRKSLILIAEEDTLLSDFYQECLSKEGGSDVVITHNPQSAISELRTKSFDFAICGGTGWCEVHDALKQLIPGRYYVYTGDRRMYLDLKKKEVYVFLKGKSKRLDLLIDWTLTRLKDEGFPCIPLEEVRDIYQS